MFEKNKLTIALIILHIKEEEIFHIQLIFQKLIRVVKNK